MTKEELIRLIEDFAEAAVQEHIESEACDDEAHERAEAKTEELRNQIWWIVMEGFVQ